MSVDHARTILARAEEAAKTAQTAFAAGDLVHAVAAITLAAQLIEEAKIWLPPSSGVRS